MRRYKGVQHVAEGILEDAGISLPANDPARVIGDKNLKTASSARIVPIHSALLELGLLAYVDKMRKAGKPRLWMNLEQKREGFRCAPAPET